MSNIDKQWLQQKIAEMEAARDDIPFGLDDDDSNTLAAMKLALASLEAGAVITVGDDGGDALAYRRLIQTFAPGTKLYTASPAPVSVMDEAQSRELFEKNCMANIERNKWHPDLYAHLPAREQWAAWEACRAVMLQGADTELQRKAAIHDALCEKYNVESLADFVDWQRNHIAELEAAPPAPVGEGETAVMPDYPGYVMTQRECYQAGKKVGLAEAGNSPVIPDGWVACSERMPHIGVPVITCCGDVVQYAAYAWDGKEWQDWYEEYDKLPANTFTHWHPRPAAPQQEV